jgi:nicotinate-nucleotide adenylyltransferase
MIIGLFGGSFNPPHIGHMMACYHILATTDIDKIWLLPCYRHAFNKELISFEHRINMCTQASKLFNNHVIVSTIENELGPKNWTIDTVSLLKKKYPHITFIFIMGNELLCESTKWKDYDKLKKIIKFYILNRTEENNNGFISRVSSSLVRQKIKNKESIQGLVPSSVADYIKQHKLYQ